MLQTGFHLMETDGGGSLGVGGAPSAWGLTTECGGGVVSQTDSMAGASMSLTDIEVEAVGRRWFDAGHRNRDPNQEVISHWRERSEMSFQRGAPLLNMHPRDGRRSPPEKICSVCNNTHRHTHTHHLVRYELVEKKLSHCSSTPRPPLVSGPALRQASVNNNNKGNSDSVAGFRLTRGRGRSWAAEPENWISLQDRHMSGHHVSWVQDTSQLVIIF